MSWPELASVAALAAAGLAVAPIVWWEQRLREAEAAAPPGTDDGTSFIRSS